MTRFAESFPESLLRIRPWAGRPEAESSQAQWPQGEEKEVTWENTIVKKRWGGRQKWAVPANGNSICKGRNMQQIWAIKWLGTSRGWDRMQGPAGEASRLHCGGGRTGPGNGEPRELGGQGVTYQMGILERLWSPETVTPRPDHHLVSACSCC